MTKHEWIQSIIAGNKEVPIAQHWIGFFNGDVARKLTPSNCHYEPMWVHDVPLQFDNSSMTTESLERMIHFNNVTGRCFSCLGVGANLAFGQGAPGGFFSRMIERKEDEMVFEYETGVIVKIRPYPYFYHSYNHPVKSRQDLETLVLPNPADPKRYKALAQNVQYLHSRGEYVLGSINGFFSGLHYFLMDFENVLISLISQPDLIFELLERLGHWNITAAGMMIEAGVDGIALCDDLGSRQSLLISPSKYRQFFKPWHKKLCKISHSKDVTVHLHSHGAIGLILDDLAECGFDFINPFDPKEGHNINQVLKTYSDRFIVVGGIPASFWDWDEQQQKNFLEQMASLARKYGRFIFMDAGGIPENISRDDFERIIEMSRRVRGVDTITGCV